MIEDLLLLHCVFLRKWLRYVPHLTVCTVAIQGAGMVYDRATLIPPGRFLKNTHSRDSSPGILNRTVLRQTGGAKRESSFPRGNESQQGMGVIEERLLWGWRQGRGGSGAAMVGQVEWNGNERTMFALWGVSTRSTLNANTRGFWWCHSIQCRVGLGCGQSWEKQN